MPIRTAEYHAGSRAHVPDAADAAFDGAAGAGEGAEEGEELPAAAAAALGAGGVVASNFNQLFKASLRGRRPTGSGLTRLYPGPGISVAADCGH
jgi:hypothetical protein